MVSVAHHGVRHVHPLGRPSRVPMGPVRRRGFPFWGCNTKDRSYSPEEVNQKMPFCMKRKWCGVPLGTWEILEDEPTPVP